MLKLRAIFSRKGTIRKKSTEQPKEGIGKDPDVGAIAGNRTNVFDRFDLPKINLPDVEEISPNAVEVTLVACGTCGRTFAPAVLARHRSACERSAANATKRKIFDSSKQRKEGTEMEQFPSSPTSASSKLKTPVLKKKPASLTNSSSALAAETKSMTSSGHVNSSGGSFQLSSSLQTLTGTGVAGGTCPHCERVFNQRALDRHVEWCATKCQRPAPIRDVAAEVALHRLHTRTRYKPPTPAGSRAHVVAQQQRQHQQQHLQKQQQQSCLQPDYDPYKSAALQMKRLMASQLDLTAAMPVTVSNMSLSAPTPTRGRSVPRSTSNQNDVSNVSRAAQKVSTLSLNSSMKTRQVAKSPKVERRTSNLSNSMNSKQLGSNSSLRVNTLPISNRCNKISDKYMKKPEIFNLDSFLNDYQENAEGPDYIDPRLINHRDNLPVNIDVDILRSSESLLSDDNLPREFESFTVQSTKRNSKTSKKERKQKSSSIDSLSHQYDDIMHSLENSIANKLSRINGGDVDLEDLINDFDRELAACSGGGREGRAGDSDGNQPSGETDEERTNGSKASQDSAYNSLRRSRRALDSSSIVSNTNRMPRGPRATRPRRISTDSSTPSSTESGTVCTVEGSALMSRSGGPGAVISSVVGGGGGGGGRPARFCHECGYGFPSAPAPAHYCAACGAKRLILSVS